MGQGGREGGMEGWREGRRGTSFPPNRLVCSLSASLKRLVLASILIVPRQSGHRAGIERETTVKSWERASKQAKIINKSKNTSVKLSRAEQSRAE